MSNVRNWAVGLAVEAFILFSPVLAFLIVITAEMLIDVVLEAGAIATCAVAAGGVALVLFRKHWPGPDITTQPGQEQVCDEAAIAASRM